MIVLLSVVACSGLAGDPEIVATIPPQAFAEQPESAVAVADAPAISPSIALGEQIYAENCTACHGETGDGDGQLVQTGEIEMTADFTAPEANDNVTPADWYDVITNGRLEVLMPPWSGSLSDMERWSVTMYLYTLSYPAEQIAFGENIFARECAECHGENGQGTADGVALAAFHNSSDNALFTQITNGNGEMPAFADTLSAEERAAVVTHVRTLTEASAVTDEPVVDNGTLTEAPAAQGQGPAPLITGNISGSIVHGTADGIVPDNMVAKLHLMGGEFGDVTLDGEVAADGTYQFEQIPIDPNHTIVVAVEYNDGTYVSEFVSGTNVTGDLDLPVTIYDLTYDPGVLRVASLISQIFTDQQTLQVFEIIEVWNDSDRIYMGTDASDDGPTSAQTVSFTLPDNAEFIDITGDGRYTISDDGRVVTDSLPVLPGEPHVVHLAYVLPYQERTNIAQTIEYPFEGRIEVHADTHSLAIESDLLAPIGSYQPSATTSLTAYGAAANLAVGDAFTYDVVGIASQVAATATDTGSSDESIIPYVLLGFGISMVVGSGGFLVFDNRRRKQAEAAAAPTQDELIKMIAALDLAYQAGEVDEVAYLAKREELKAQVSTLIKQQ